MYAIYRGGVILCTHSNGTSCHWNAVSPSSRLEIRARETRWQRFNGVPSSSGSSVTKRPADTGGDVSDCKKNRRVLCLFSANTRLSVSFIISVLSGARGVSPDRNNSIRRVALSHTSYVSIIRICSVDRRRFRHLHRQRPSDDAISLSLGSGVFLRPRSAVKRHWFARISRVFSLFLSRRTTFRYCLSRAQNKSQKPLTFSVFYSRRRRRRRHTRTMRRRSGAHGIWCAFAAAIASTLLTTSTNSIELGTCIAQGRERRRSGGFFVITEYATHGVKRRGYT